MIKKVVTLAKTNAIGEIMEIILYVEDINGQVSFYRDKLGFKVKTPQESADYSNEFWVELDTGSCSLASTLEASVDLGLMHRSLYFGLATF